MFLYLYQDMVLMVCACVCVCVYCVTFLSQYKLRMGWKFGIILYVGFGIQFEQLSFIILMRSGSVWKAYLYLLTGWYNIYVELFHYFHQGYREAYIKTLPTETAFRKACCYLFPSPPSTPRGHRPELWPSWVIRQELAAGFSGHRGKVLQWTLYSLRLKPKTSHKVKKRSIWQVKHSIKTRQATCD